MRSINHLDCIAAIVVPPLFSHFYYMTHKDNLESILRLGILSHAEVAHRRLARVDISDPGVQRWRCWREPVFGRAIHAYVPLYLNPRNPMLYALRDRQRDLVILAVAPAVLDSADRVFTDGNAACRATLFSADDSVLDDSLEVLRAEWWSSYAQGKRRRCAEVLIHDRVAPAHIVRLLCSDRAVAGRLARQYDVPVAMGRGLFFS